MFSCRCSVSLVLLLSFCPVTHMFFNPTLSRHNRGRWRSRVEFSTRNPALWAPLHRGPISRMNRMTARRTLGAGPRLTATVKTLRQRATKTTEEWVTCLCVWTCVWRRCVWFSGCVCTCECWVMSSGLSTYTVPCHCVCESCDVVSMICGVKWCHGFSSCECGAVVLAETQKSQQ